MDQADRALIEQLKVTNEELAVLVEAHSAFEKKLEEMESRRYLSTSEQMEMADLKKRKLRGKDRIHQILIEYRKSLN